MWSDHSSEIVGVGHGADWRMGHGIELDEIGNEGISFQSDIGAFISWKITVIWCTEDSHALFVVGFLVALGFHFMGADQ